MSPPRCGSAANTARAVSVRPEPSSPARPTISPVRTVSEASDTRRPTARPFTVRTSPPAARAAPEKAVAPCFLTSARSRPSMVATSCSLLMSAMGATATVRPSRITVTRSHTL